MSVKVLIVDDSFFFRKRLSEAIDGKKGIEVVGFASNGREAIELVEKLRPDVVTLDVEMPEVNGLDALKTIIRMDIKQLDRDYVEEYAKYLTAMRDYNDVVVNLNSLGCSYSYLDDNIKRETLY